MRAVIQRVSSARVTVDKQKSAGEIGQGLLVLLGIMKGDTEHEAEILAKKIAHLRIFSDENEKQNLSLLTVAGELLVVSNFTLGADCSHGRRPFYGDSAVPNEADQLYRHFLSCAGQELGRQPQSGEFGAHMDIETVLDGPITIMLDTEALA